MVKRLHHHYFVAGHPIRHSLSPTIFKNFAASLNIPLVYSRLNTVSTDDILLLLQAGFEGCNVTSPLKEKVCSLPFEQSLTVRKISSANVIYRHENEWILENTDIIGVQGALEPFRKEIEHQPAAVIGAGGAGRSAIEALKSFTQEIYLINRTYEKARYWADKLNVVPIPLSDALNVITKVKTIVNTLDIPLNFSAEKHHVILDASYKNHPLQKTAQQQHATYISGKFWLLHQAIPAFKLLTHLQPPSHFIFEEKKLEHQNYFFIGMMKSGKTTIGKLFAQARELPFIDLDYYIEEKHQASIAQLFERHGEEGFRQLESMALQEVLKNGKHPQVISTGGGSILLTESRNLLRAYGYVIWLYTSLAELQQRQNNVPRPLLKSPKDLSNIYYTRFPIYAKISDEIIVTDNKSPKEILGLLLE